MIVRMIMGKLGHLLIMSLIAFGLFLWVNNTQLRRKQEILSDKALNQEGIIAIQKKVINVVKNTKSTNLAGNIKRMQDGKL